MRRRLTPLILALLVPIALLAGLWLGGHPQGLPDFVRDAFVGDEEAQVYQEVLDRIDADFYRDVDKAEIASKSLAAAVAALDDPFSRYIDPETRAEFDADTTGQFEGVGMNVQEIKRGLRVLNVFDGGPADEAGIKAGDLIVEVNDQSLEGTSSEDSTTQIKGPAGTMVELTIISDGKRRNVDVERAAVSVPVSEKRLETEDGKKIGYVTLSQFTAGAHGYVLSNVRDMLKRGAEGIVLDLRHNGGGLLQEGVLTASVFIPDGLIVSTRGRNRPERRFNASGDSIDTDIPVAVLVDAGTASASEIVTGALQDRDRATVVGTQTFGKGVFQEIEDLPNGGALDITVGEYFTPDGRNLGPSKGERGLTPDVEVEDDPDTKPDEALQRALDVVAADLSPSAEPVVAVLEKRGRLLTASPFFERAPRINVNKDSRARVGDLALVSPKGKLVRRIGRPDVARDVIEALMLDRGLRRRFPPDVDRAAREAQPSRDGRRDLTGLATFTIDPPTARDFDDAISAERRGDGIRIWVHIADVSAHVKPGSPVDREAHRRATSVYVPGKVEPMLPEALSNDACSLRPHEDRLAVTAELDFAGAVVSSASFYRSVIRSDARLDYPQVDRVFAGAERAQEPWAGPLEAAREVAAALEARRAQRGALEVTSSETSYAFDARGHVLDHEPDEQTESHRLIEHLMIAANEAVAGLLEDRGLPALYRVHERPDGARIARLADQLESLEVPTPALPDTLTQEQAMDAVGDISRRVAEYVASSGRGRLGFTTLVLRSLKQAYYTPENKGHAGLRSARYCHFTSPIRRYPDLVVHRALLAAINAGEDMPDRRGLDELGTWCSQRERDAMSIERKADDVAGTFLLERRLFEEGWQREWQGEVTGVIGAGAFIAFEGFEGMLPVRRLRGEWWEVNELETALVGTRSERGIRIGDPVVVQVAKVDTARGRVDLSPVELKT